MGELVDTFANRLNTAMRIRNIKPSELSLQTGISKSSLSEYMKGRYEAKQDGILLLAQVLNVNETWLMGLDVPMEKTSKIILDVEGLDEQTIKEIENFIQFKKDLLKSKK